MIRAWRASYDPALAVRTGERVRLGRRDDEYPGWIWCVNAAGLGGWLPADLLSSDDRVLRDFNTMELSAEEGETVEIFEDCLGWTFARRADGAEGWIPSTHLAR